MLFFLSTALISPPDSSAQEDEGFKVRLNHVGVEILYSPDEVTIKKEESVNKLSFM